MATSTSGSPNEGRAADLAFSLASRIPPVNCFWTRDNRTLHAGAGGGCGRSSAISHSISWNICRGMANLGHLECDVVLMPE